MALRTVRVKCVVCALQVMHRDGEWGEEEEGPHLHHKEHGSRLSTKNTLSWDSDIILSYFCPSSPKMYQLASIAA